MEITARELRDVEIAEAFRGYNREVVNDLLERAASTVEAGEHKLQELTERLKAAQLEADRGRETEDMLHRTLLLAQRAADEAVGEAQEKSREMMEQAELESHKLVADAQAEAQRYGEEERIRLEDEVVDLATRRDTLLADVDALTRYESDYRDRVAAALEQDLDAVRNRTTGSPGALPEMSSVELPAAREGFARSGVASEVSDTDTGTDTGTDSSDIEEWYEPAVVSTDVGVAAVPVDVDADLDAEDELQNEAADEPETTSESDRDAGSFFATTEVGENGDAGAVAEDVVGDDVVGEDALAQDARADDARADDARADEDGGTGHNAFEPTTAAFATDIPTGTVIEREAFAGEPTRQVNATALFDAESPDAELVDADSGGPASVGAPPRDAVFDPLRPAALDTGVLDDDAFFATLREAVHDETPLGPRDDNEDVEVEVYGDSGERSSFRDVFRRRR